MVCKGDINVTNLLSWIADIQSHPMRPAIKLNYRMNDRIHDASIVLSFTQKPIESCERKSIDLGRIQVAN